jgi:hypothetical protein
MYHVELRQFPRNLSRFNLGQGELEAILIPWAREQVVELGEGKWSPYQARLTVLEGPQLSVQEISMGRGWRTAERRSEDVTERVLAQVRAALAAADAAAPPAASAPAGAAGPSAPAASAPAAAAPGPPIADPLALGVQLASLLGGHPTRLLSAWREIAARAPELTPSESLALAEREIASAASEHGR